MLRIKKIKPLFNRVLVTADCYKDDIKEGGLVTKVAGALKEYQKVIAVGSTVRDINVGDVVLVNPTRYAVMKHQEGSLKDGVIADNPVVKYNFHMVYIEDIPHILLYDTDIDYVLEKFEDNTDDEQLIHFNKQIIV